MRITVQGNPNFNYNFEENVLRSEKPVLVFFQDNSAYCADERTMEERRGFDKMARLYLNAFKTVNVVREDIWQRITGISGADAFARKKLPCYAMYKKGYPVGFMSTAHENDAASALKALEKFIDETKGLTPPESWRSHVTYVDARNFKREVLKSDLPVLVRVDSQSAAMKETDERAHFFALAKDGVGHIKTVNIVLDPWGHDVPEEAYVGLATPFYMMFNKGVCVGSMSINRQRNFAPDEVPGKLEAFVQEKMHATKPEEPEYLRAPVVTDRTFRQEVVKSEKPVLVFFGFAGAGETPLTQAVDAIAQTHKDRFRTVRVLADNGGGKTYDSHVYDDGIRFLMFSGGRVVSALAVEGQHADACSALYGYLDRAAPGIPVDAGFDLKEQKREAAKKLERLQQAAREKAGKAEKPAARPHRSPLSGIFRLIAGAALLTGLSYATPDEAVEAAAKDEGLSDVKLTGIAFPIGKTFTGRTMDGEDIEGKVVAPPFAKKGFVMQMWKRTP